MPYRSTLWTDTALAFFLANWQQIGDKELAKLLTEREGQAYKLKNVEKKRAYMGLFRTKEQLRAIKARNAEAGAWMSEKCCAARGNRAYKEGEETVWRTGAGRQVKVVKTGRQMKPAYRHNWELANGPIPKGMMLRCKTTDRLNCAPDNWELVTRAEHAKRNQEILGEGRYLTDAFVAYSLTVKQPHLREEIKQHRELMELQRASIRMNLTIKAHERSTAA